MTTRLFNFFRSRQQGLGTTANTQKNKDLPCGSAFPDEYCLSISDDEVDALLDEYDKERRGILVTSEEG